MQDNEVNVKQGCFFPKVWIRSTSFPGLVWKMAAWRDRSGIDPRWICYRGDDWFNGIAYG